MQRPRSSAVIGCECSLRGFFSALGPGNLRVRPWASVIAVIGVSWGGAGMHFFIFYKSPGVENQRRQRQTAVWRHCLGPHRPNTKLQ